MTSLICRFPNVLALVPILAVFVVAGTMLPVISTLLVYTVPKRRVLSPTFCEPSVDAGIICPVTLPAISKLLVCVVPNLCVLEPRFCEPFVVGMMLVVTAVKSTLDTVPPPPPPSLPPVKNGIFPLTIFGDNSRANWLVYLV